MTTTITQTVARKARPADRAAMVAAMAAAFQDDPVFRWMSPDDDHRRRILPDFFNLAKGIFARHGEPPRFRIPDPIRSGPERRTIYARTAQEVHT
jgi:hypothetical protein